VDPLQQFERQLEDLKVMPNSVRPNRRKRSYKFSRKLERDVAKFVKELEAFELRIS